MKNKVNLNKNTESIYYRLHIHLLTIVFFILLPIFIGTMIITIIYNTPFVYYNIVFLTYSLFLMSSITFKLLDKRSKKKLKLKNGDTT